ncbi:hypothetical protein M9Y10_012626 [Tritrichomonas musculus]|uniref:Uncharacterized protein n=1 Tax=Tritrichomonas musculus TaxID=1915356 RepID=A0ABR2ICZ0_9EUKA
MTIKYEAFKTILTDSSNVLLKFDKEFDVLRHEIQQINSLPAKNLLNILSITKEENTKYEKILAIIDGLIKLEINESGILNLTRILLILYYSFLLRAYYSPNENKEPKDSDKEENEKMKNLYGIYHNLKNFHLQDIFSPLLFFVGIFYISFPKSGRIGGEIQKVLNEFPIFEIIKTNWLQTAYQAFSKYSYRIFNYLIFYALKIFFYVLEFTNSEKEKKLDREKIVPLLLFIFSHQSKGDRLDHYFYESFENNNEDKSYKVFSNRFNEFFFLIMSNAIKSNETATKVWVSLNDNKNINFMDELQKSLNSLSSTISSNTTEEKYQDKFIYIKLLYKFCKYLKDAHFKELITKCFKSRSTGINSNIDEVSKCFISLIYFITDFLWNPKLCIYASKILEQLTKKNPILMADYYNALFENKFSDVVKIIDESSNDHRLIIPFINAADHFIHYHFTYNSFIPRLPLFVNYFIFNFFPSAVYRQYQNQRAQWKVFITLVKTANELIITDYSCLQYAHENQEFITALINLIIYGANNIYSTCRNNETTLSNKKSKNKDKKSYNDSINNSLNYKDLCCQIKFEVYSLNILQNLISIHIRKNEQPTLLYRELFNDRWVSSLIFALTNFLTLSSEFEEIDRQLYRIRSLSFNIVELLCAAAYKIGNESFEIYYPKKCHEIYSGIVYSTLYRHKKHLAMIRVLDFASSVVETQKTFAYSLLRQNYFAFITEQLIKFNPTIKNQANWKIYATVFQLVSKLFINLNTNTEIIKRLIFPEKIKNMLNDDKVTPTVKANPIQQNKKPSDICSENMSPIWCTIIDFIFDPSDTIFKEDNNEYKILSIARLLKSVISIFLCVDYPLLDIKTISTFMINVFQLLFEKEKNEKNFSIILNNDIDLNNFKNYEPHPRPEEFYINVSRLKDFINGNNDKTTQDSEQLNKILIKNVEELNKRLFLIDCKTELISSIHSLINLFSIFPDKITDSSNAMTADKKPKENGDEAKIKNNNIDKLLNFATDALKIKILPITTIEEVFKLIESIIVFPKLEALEFSNESFKNFLEAARDFLKVTQNSSKVTTVFKVVTQLLQLKEIVENELIIQNGRRGVLMDLFSIACRSISDEAPDKFATSLIIEVSYKVRDEPSILEDGNAIIFLSFFKTMINTKFAIHALKATRILCTQQYSTENLEKVGFFDYLISSMEPGQNGLTKDSELWPHIFSIFLSLPPQSPITAKFICISFPYIVFFLNEKLESEKEGYASIKSKTDPNILEKDTNLIQTQESIMNLISHVSNNVSKLAIENPSTLQALTELIYIQLESSFKIIHRIYKKSDINFKNLLNIESHTIPTSSILIIHSCLLSLNNMAGHPFMTLPRGFQKEGSDQSIMNLLILAIEDLGNILQKIKDKDKTEPDRRLRFSKVIFQSIEMAAQLFYGLCKSNPSSNLNKDERRKTDSRYRKFNAAVDFTVTSIQENKESDFYFDIDFLNNTTQKVKLLR